MKRCFFYAILNNIINTREVVERSVFMKAKREKKNKNKPKAFDEIKAKESLEKRRAESEAERIKAEIENKKREEYVKRLNEERIALLKAKHDGGDLGEIISEEIVENKLTFKERISSFIYLNKWWLGIASCCAFVLGFITFDLLTKENPDLTILLLTNEIGFYSKSTEISELFGEYIGDVNGDGKVIVNIHYIPISGEDNDDSTEMQADPYMLNQHRLNSEIQTGMGVIVIADSCSDEQLDPENNLLNLSELFPENKHIDKYGFYIKNTEFTKIIRCDDDINNDVYIGIREPKAGISSEKKVRDNFKIAYPVLEKLIEDIS